MTTTNANLADTASDAHETSGPPIVGDVASFPSHAELSRTLIEPGGVATLSTLTRSGHPYASVAPYSALTNGAPLICVSSLAEHTQNLRYDPRSSVLVEAPSKPGVDPLSLARVTVVGAFMPAEPSDAEIEAHLDLHPFARHYVGFADFSWWRLDVLNLRYVGGFGAMGWASAAEYSSASADPVLPHAAPMIEHLDADHADACLSIVQQLAGVAGATRAPVSSIDRYGMTFDAFRDDAYLATARVAFPEPLSGAASVREASIDLVRRAAAAS
ncbi:MAG: HugZ family protein [Ilumatobacter sp.]